MGFLGSRTGNRSTGGHLEQAGQPLTANIVDPWRLAALHSQLPLLKLLASSRPAFHLISLPCTAWRCARDADMARRLWDKSEELVQAALLKAGLA